jgi:hypothetical protein
MEQKSTQNERIEQLLASKRQRVRAKAEVPARTRLAHCWRCICLGNVPMAMSEFSHAVRTTYNTIVNPNAGVRRKR